MTPLRFLFVFVFLCTRCFLIHRLRKYVPAIIASIMAKFGQFLWERFWNIWKRSFNHKNIETAWRKHPQLPPFPFFSPQFYISKSLPIYGCQLWKVWKYRQRVRDRQRRRGRRVAELSRAFKQTALFRATPVLFRTNKSYKVNDQRCLSFVYSFTDIYLHSHFSLALFIWEIWKSYILLHENTRL